MQAELYRALLITTLVSSELIAQEASKAAPLLISAIEERYTSQLNRVEGDLVKVRKAAGDARLKSYKELLLETTKAGDFDKAAAVKSRIQELEKQSNAATTPTRPRPKETVKFGGHTYAIIKEPAPWHVAKKRCEEMGGHLVILDSTKEFAYIATLCKKEATSAWVGATDEESEGAWKWVDGSDAKFDSPHINNVDDSEHYMLLDLERSNFNDVRTGRFNYVCEWDK